MIATAVIVVSVEEVLVPMRAALILDVHPHERHQTLSRPVPVPVPVVAPTSRRPQPYEATSSVESTAPSTACLG